MVEYALNLDSVFGCLADPTRRDILQRVARRELSVNEIAQPYDLTLAAISKHLKVLERAALIMKRKRGKQHMVQLSPMAFKDANEYLKYYEAFMNERLDALEDYLNREDA